MKMKSAISALLMLFATFAGGCGGPIQKVKNGVLKADTSVMLGMALDKYKYFKETKWETIKTEQGKIVVQFTGIMNLDAYCGTTWLGETISTEMVQKASSMFANEFQMSYACQFVLSKSDGSFDIAYSEIGITENKLFNGKPFPAQMVPYGDKGQSMITEVIYKNGPFSEVQMMIFSLSKSAEERKSK